MAKAKKQEVNVERLAAFIAEWFQIRVEVNKKIAEMAILNRSLDGAKADLAEQEQKYFAGEAVHAVCLRAYTIMLQLQKKKRENQHEFEEAYHKIFALEEKVFGTNSKPTGIPLDHEYEIAWEVDKDNKTGRVTARCIAPPEPAAPAKKKRGKKP